MEIEGAEPTDNRAEQKIRSGVLWHNSSFGTQGEADGRFVERILSVVSTLKQQNRNVLDYLTEACEAANCGRTAPELQPPLPILAESNALIP